jgi:hypothetical protein
MPKPRVFISHSTSGDPAEYASRKVPDDAAARAGLEARERFAKDVCDGLAGAMAAGGHHAVLLDRRGIQEGDAWHAKLNVWLTGCDAAVVLLTPRALQSTFVQYEANVLCHRHWRTKGAFPLFPVHLLPVDQKAVEASQLKASRMHEIQAFKPSATATVDEVVARVMAALNAVPFGSTPLELQIRLVSEKLRAVDRPVIDALLDDLDVDLGDWDFDEDSAPRKLAAKLMGAGLKAARPILRELRGHLSASDHRALKEIVNRVGSAWVPQPATSQLPEAAKGTRGLAAGLASPLSARMLVWQAYPRVSTLDHYAVAEVGAVCGQAAGDAYVKELEGQIARALSTALERGSPEQALRRLAVLAENEEPVFVVLPYEGLSGDVLASLEANPAFRGITFFVLAGAGKPPAAFLEKAGMTWLEPAVARESEVQYCESYDRTCEYLLEKPARARHAPASGSAEDEEDEDEG